MEEEIKFEVRDKRASTQTSTPVSPSIKSEEKPKAKEVQEEPASMMPVTFSSLVLSMATSALIHLGQEANPATGKQTVELRMAGQVIDLLSLLQEKTKGNLTGEEEGVLSQTLFALRMKFVEVEKKRPHGI